jgi:alkylation response protein AidB-like acyl-CoA dehydrogenase
MSRVEELCKQVESLEAHLGDPHDPAGPLSFRRLLELDEREEYPHSELDHLHRWGCHEYAHPVDAGGRATAIQDSVPLSVAVARRDATLATALSITMLAWMPIWVGGTDEQKRHYGAAVRGGAKFVWALSERDHGSDVLAGTTTATRVDGGYLVSGQKWLIGNCTYADHVVLFARTAARGGPAGFSILVLDVRSVPAGQLRRLPDNRLLGLRGIDMSGIELDNCFVPGSALIGAEGHGLEIMLQSTQQVRVLITSVAIGCADTALRLTLDFAGARRLSGHLVRDIPYSRRQLTEGFADVLLCDTVTTTAARGLQAAPDQSSIWSATTKYLVPTLLTRTVAELAVVLGARHYLRDHPRFGAFQKAGRDLSVANFADGNTTVNLRTLVMQVDAVLAVSLDPPPERLAATEERLAALFDWDAALPDYRPWDARTISRTGDDALLALRYVPDRLRALADRADRPAEADRWRRCAEFTGELLGELRQLAADSARLHERSGPDYPGSADAYRLAERFCVLHAAATCLAQRAWSGGWVPAECGAAVLLVTLDRLWHRLHPTDALADAEAYEEVAEVMTTLHADGRSFGYRMFRLPDSPFAPRDADW